MCSITSHMVMMPNCSALSLRDVRSRNGLVMSAVIEGRSVVIVLLDSFGKYTRVADAQRIKTWMAGNSSSNPRFQVSIR